MKRSILCIILVLMIVACSLSNRLGSSDATPESCTIFTAAFGDTVLFGNNEDYTNPNTYYWISPSRLLFYGSIYVGYDNFSPQGGINEKGLAFDYNSVPRAALNSHPELPPLSGNSGAMFLRECATVEEAIDMAKSYDWGTSLRYQIHLADATGDAVVISAGPDGELAFTRKEKGNGYLVSTNFNLAFYQEDEREGLCRRYDTAVSMLEKIEDENDLTVEYFASILDAVHAEGSSTNTLYSNVFDLKNGLIYLYYWHQFDEVVTLNVTEEVAENPSPTRIEDLFLQETVEETPGEYQKDQKKAENGGICLGTTLVTAMIIGFLLLYTRSKFRSF